MTEQDIAARRKRDLERYHRQTAGASRPGALRQMRQAPAGGAPRLVRAVRSQEAARRPRPTTG